MTDMTVNEIISNLEGDFVNVTMSLKNYEYIKRLIARDEKHREACRNYQKKVRQTENPISSSK